MKKMKIFLFSILLLSSCSINGVVNSSSVEVSSSSETSLSESSLIESSSSSSSIRTSHLEKTRYSNPIRFHKQDGSLYSVYCADPDIIKGDDGAYYMYCTNTDCEMGNKGIMYDRGPIFKSENLIDWTWVGSVFDGQTDILSWGTPEAGVWAPSVIKVGKMYNYYYSLSTLGDENPGIGVATSPTPYGPWKHYGKVLDSKITGVRNSIDPQALYYQDKLYLVWGSFFGIGIVELTDDGIEPYYGTNKLSEYVQYIIPDNTDGGDMNLDINYEGSFIIEKDDKYYYFGSQGTCLSGTNSTYTVKVGVSNSLFGPYLGSDGKELSDKEGSFGDVVVQPSDEVAGTGHNTIIKDENGEYWIFYHGYDINGENPGYRIPFIDKLLWDEKTGMPYVEDRKASIHVEKDGPTIAVYD